MISTGLVPEKAAAPRLKELDSLRGIAAFGVMLLHFTTDFHRDFSPVGISSMTWVWGNYGVHLFFLISGFVIFMTAERSSGPRAFVVSRFARLFPAYWVAVLFTTALLIFVPVTRQPESWKMVLRALANLTMVQDRLGVGSVDSVYWTLAVEISFYAILLFLIWRKALDMALNVLTGLVVLALVDHLFVPRPLNPVYQYFSGLLILEYVPFFTVGMVLYKARERFRSHHALILLLCWTTISVAWYFPHNQMMDIPVITGVILVFWLAVSGRLPWLSARPLVYLGRISYSLYITHHWAGLTFLKVADNQGMDPNLALVLALVLCLAIASILSHFVEYPGLKWLREKLG